MQRVYTAQDYMLVGHLATVLKEEGIECHVRNDMLTGGAGELPPTDVWPEIMVAEEDAERASEIIASVLAAGEDPGEPWRCPECGEQVDGEFSECWNCQAPMPTDDRG